MAMLGSLAPFGQCAWALTEPLLHPRCLCVSPPLPPQLRLDVTNSWICTFPHQKQRAPHHRLVQIWSEHTQNPPAARWWIGILGTMLMHQSGARRQMTVNCFSDKSAVWDSRTEDGLKPSPGDVGRRVGGGCGVGVPGNLVREIRWWPHLSLLGYADYLEVASVISSLFGKCKGEIEQSAATVSLWVVLQLKYDEISPMALWYQLQLWRKHQLLTETNSFYCIFTLNKTHKCSVPLIEWTCRFPSWFSSVHKAPVWISVMVRRPSKAWSRSRMKTNSPGLIWSSSRVQTEATVRGAIKLMWSKKMAPPEREAGWKPPLKCGSSGPDRRDTVMKFLLDFWFVFFLRAKAKYSKTTAVTCWLKNW